LEVFILIKNETNVSDFLGTLVSIFIQLC